MNRLFLLVVLFLISCAQKTWVIEGSTSLNKGFKVSIRMDEWKYEPRSLPRYVMPIYLDVKNTTDDNIKITSEDVYITDTRGNRYKPMDALQVNEIIRQELAWWYPYFWFLPGDFPDILNLGFQFGDIPSNTRRAGFVYFPALPSEMDTAVLHVKDYEFNLKLLKD